MSRLIDADALIAQCGNWYIEEGTEEGFIGSLKQLIDLMPTIEPEQRWIPCSERMPEIGKEVLLSEPNTMFIAEYHGSGDPEGLWIVEGYHHYLADVNGCAWMPLPTPYEEVEDD